MRHLKEEFDKLTFKEVLVYSLAIVCSVAGWTLLFLGMYLPPTGQIHESVLTAFGLNLVFVGSLLGISMHYANEAKKFKESITQYVAQIVSSNTGSVSEASPGNSVES